MNKNYTTETVDATINVSMILQETQLHTFCPKSKAAQETIEGIYLPKVEKNKHGITPPL